jgi:prepilin-type N-terminal cleavage/methylation domain-containing protein
MFRQSRRAFTLVEILMVVTILAIASAIIVPQLSSRDDLKAAAGARVVMADMIWAQNRAISTQQKQYMVFNGQSYTLWYKNSSGTLTQSTNPVTQQTYTQTFGVSGTPLENVTLGTGSFNSQASLCFDEMGTPYGYDGTNETAMTAAGTLQVTCGSDSLTITVEGYTGETSVQ